MPEVPRGGAANGNGGRTEALGSGGVRLEWDAGTRRLIEPGAGYGRMIRLERHGGEVLCSYEKAGESWVRRSRDGGKTFGAPVRAMRYAQGAAANPETLELKSGRLLLFVNERPRGGAGPDARFGIHLAASDDGGRTWTPRAAGPLFQADSDPRNGCWEPAAIQTTSGEVLLFFANESPFRASDEQEISLCRSTDEGATWTAPCRVIFRAGRRDGMPVPLLLKNGQLAVAIEDNGLPNAPHFQPVVVTGGVREWVEGAPAAGNSARRRAAVTAPPLGRDVYAGAPYLRQLPSGETLLSCQSTEGRPGGGDPLRRARMAVYVGDRDARNFTGRTFPFGDANPGAAGLWNALFVRDASTVTALSGTTIGGVSGLWAVDARVVRR